MESPTTIHERRQLNQEIEEAYIKAALSSTAIHRRLQTDRGDAILDLYENFYSAFDYLFFLTCDMKQLEPATNEISKARDWLDHSINSDDEPKLISRCKEGYLALSEYKKVLIKQGIIALPSR